MLKSGTWPGNVAVEPLSDMDSSGSCDSVISTNSGCSDDSMEHLTPEERACLMFLEETIEALEVQEDSGLSNDEPDPWTKTKHQMRVNGISSLASQPDSQGMPTPPSPAVVPAHMTLTTESETEQNSEPQSTPAPSPPLFGSAPGCTSTSAVNPTEVPGLIPNGACDPETITSTWTCSEEESSEIDPSILPPPSDFMDELDAGSQPEELNDVPVPSEFSTEPEPHVEPVQINSADSVKPMSETSSLTEDTPPDASVFLRTSPPESTPPISPPPVAPKPKKLPANIVLQSQRTAVAGSDGGVRLLLSTSSDRVVENQQKVHMEALRKLGLLKDNQDETGIVQNPTLVPKYRRSWTGPSPVSPAVPHTPPLTPSYTHLSSPPLAPSSPQFVSSPVSPAPPPSPPTQDPDVLPVPAAFSDSIRPLPSINELPAGADVPDAAISTPAPPPPPAPVQQLTSPKVPDMKSTTPDPSGEGLRSNLTSPNPTKAEQRATGERSPQQLLSSRPRPSSLGSRKDILCTKVEDLQASPTAIKQPDSQRARESSKLPRSQGVSVLICPRPENIEERREALKKLGLLRD